ncbi:hypothetical protein EPUS_03434 [Endocarpon pusillum Z07020]|uniref:Uncharacterized protein n=1 Tax=Endocarpon pusillum (strain Z07020 / HMAS-L-300199) TaxID=1263415 RepID=U1HXR1_ENDPU|nr:uncharacterized protein EPUS_03434 [Endocarpon pusillum Z07020]ERF74244.1 hypothetical protein EPUS_03434 [Endocarpon pusillum Z07020]
MAAAETNDMDNAFDDHPSLSASLEDFEEHQTRSPLFDLPSQHSGFKSEPDDSDIDERSSNGAPWSPPGFRRHARGGSRGAGSWFRHDPYGTAQRFELRPSISPSRSRQTSPEYEDARGGDEDLTIPANIPLPAGTDSPLKERSPEPRAAKDEFAPAFAEEEQKAVNDTNNYIRFAVRAEVQHREPFMALFNFLRERIDLMTKTKSSTMMTIILSLFSISIIRMLFVPPIPPPVPDLVKLSTLAKSFEPLIFYSENGYTQITALQETSVAVWDLGESVRSANMTSAPLIVRSLDELSESLKTLGLELNRFFADVDSDVDSILLVMDWAKRELSGVANPQGPAIPSLIFDNIHNLLNRGSLLENGGKPTLFGRLITEIFGSSSPQRTRTALTRTFHEFLNVLEESINSELTHSTALVVRESDAQERLENDLLSSLWTKLVGPNAAMLRKYDKNRQLLANVRARTVSNKHLIMEHHGRLQTLKVSLETLRRKLVSPLVRRNDSVSVGVDCVMVIEDQIRGLEGTYHYLRDVRERQKAKLMEMVYGAGSRRSGIVGVAGGGVGGGGIEAR